MADERISMVSATPTSRGRAQLSQMFGTSYVCVHITRNSHQILHGDQARCGEKNFPGSTAPPALAKIFVTRDLFAVTNLLSVISIPVICSAEFSVSLIPVN